MKHTAEWAADGLYELPKNYGLLFDVAHYSLCLLAERADVGSDFEQLRTQNPLACWVSSMMVCFAGSLLVGPLCGEPILGALTADPLRLCIASALWYFIFYSPRDMVWSTLSQKAAQVPLCILKGVYYPKKIIAGLKHGKSVYKHNLLAGVILAVVNANGSGLIKPFARLARGVWNPRGFESMKASVTTKYCLFCALLYAVFPRDVTYLIIVGILVAMKVGPLFDASVDPFTPVEAALCPLVFKGKKDEEKAKTQ